MSLALQIYQDQNGKSDEFMLFLGPRFTRATEGGCSKVQNTALQVKTRQLQLRHPNDVQHREAPPSATERHKTLETSVEETRG